MRSEAEMFDLIMSTARQDERVRAVMLNGSRANPNAPRDFFQDYDIVYFVTGLDSFLQDPHWIDRFGERMILQLPDEMGDPPAGDGPGYAYLIQFMDGNRIDMTLFPVARLDRLEEDSQTILLLDKDGLFEPFPPASDRGTLPKPPTARQFADCCNEFWWVSPYAAKGLWRRELPYAKTFQDNYLRHELMKMLNWAVGVQTGFSVNPGKLGKYLERCLPPEWWQLLLATYSDADYERTWEALLAMGALFRMAARQVGERFGYTYPQGDDDRVSAHLRHVRALPRDAMEMY